MTLRIIGILGLIIIVLWGWTQTRDISYNAAVDHVVFGEQYFSSKGEETLVYAVVFGISFLGILLSLLLFGIGSIVLFQKESCEEIKKLNAICRTLNSKFDRKPGLPEPDPKPEIPKKIKGPGLVDRLLKNLENRRPPP